MADTAARDETQIIEGAFEHRVHDIFKVFAEAIYTGEPERDAATRFRRGPVLALPAPGGGAGGRGGGLGTVCRLYFQRGSAAALRPETRPKARHSPMLPVPW